MIWDILLCYSKLALLPTHSVSAKNVGLGLSVVEVSKSGSKEIHIHINPACSPLCALVAVLLGQVAEKNRSTGADFPVHIYIHTYMCVYIYACIYISTVLAQAVANSIEPVLQFQNIIISPSWPQCYSSQPFAK